MSGAAAHERDHRGDRLSATFEHGLDRPVRTIPYPANGAAVSRGAGERVAEPDALDAAVNDDSASYQGRRVRSDYICWSGLTTPIRWPSGSLNCPSSIMSMIVSGPITRVPPRLSALASAASMSSTAT